MSDSERKEFPSLEPHFHLRGLNILGRFSVIYYKGNLFLRFPVSLSHQASSEKGSTLKGKNLLPTGSKFFPSRVEPFSEGNKNNFVKVVSFERVLVSFKSSFR